MLKQTLLEEIIKIIIEEGVKIVFTSAGNPKTYTSKLKERGITAGKTKSTLGQVKKRGVDANQHSVLSTKYSC